jgi:hypothetical protein
MKQFFGNIFVSYLLTAIIVLSAIYLLALPWIDR